MIDSSLIQALGLIIHTFKDLQIPYFIGGSVASFAYGITRSTLDADLIVDLKSDHIVPFVRKVEQTYYVDEHMIKSAVSSRQSFNMVHFETGYKIDIFIPKEREFDRNQFKNIVQKPIDSNATLIVNLAGYEDMILAKLGMVSTWQPGFRASMVRCDWNAQNSTKWGR